MADQPAVTNAPPPHLLLAVVNPVVRVVAKTPAGRVLGSTGVLRFTGRRTGRRYDVPAGIHHLGDGVYATFTSERWGLNFTGKIPVEVFLHGRRRTGTGVLIKDPDVIGETFLRVFRQLTKPKILGFAVAPGHEVTAADLAGLGRALVRIEVVDAGS